jgi:hypothetical protein
MARTSVATDNFNRADGYGLGANWTGRNVSASGTLSIASNKANGSAARTYDNTSADSWSGAGSFTDDQYASVVISGLAVQTTSYGIGVIARASGTDGSRSFYGAYVASDAASGGNQTTYLFKIVSGTATSLYSTTHSWSNGDRVEIECEGTTIRLCKNGTPLGGSWTVTDSSITTGAPGIAGGGSAVAQGDDWEGGNIGAGGGSSNGSSFGAGRALNGGRTFFGAMR